MYRSDPTAACPPPTVSQVRATASTCGPRWTSSCSSPIARSSTIPAMPTTRPPSRCSFGTVMWHKVLVANRGEIACRILRTLKRLSIRSVAVYSEADRYSAHVTQADESVRIGPGPAAQSYLRQDEILGAARATGAQAIHPGYGFLSENAEFAEACAAAGITFIGPTPAQMRSFGLKHLARELAARIGVALLPGSALLESVEHARREAVRIGYPVMLKSTAGGGGIGMQLVRREAELADAFGTVERLATKNFSRGGVFLEK